MRSLHFSFVFFCLQIWVFFVGGVVGSGRCPPLPCIHFQVPTLAGHSSDTRRTLVRATNFGCHQSHDSHLIASANDCRTHDPGIFSFKIQITPSLSRKLAREVDWISRRLLSTPSVNTANASSNQKVGIPRESQSVAGSNAFFSTIFNTWANILNTSPPRDDSLTSSFTLSTQSKPPLTYSRTIIILMS